MWRISPFELPATDSISPARISAARGAVREAEKVAEIGRLIRTPATVGVLKAESKLSITARGSLVSSVRRGPRPKRGNYALRHLVDICISVLRNKGERIEKVGDFAAWLGIEPRLLAAYENGERGEYKKGIANSGLPLRFCALLAAKTGVDSGTVNCADAYRVGVLKKPAAGLLTRRGAVFTDGEFESVVHDAGLESRAHPNSDFARMMRVAIIDDAERLAEAVQFLLMRAWEDPRDVYPLANAGIREALNEVAKQIGLAKEFRAKSNEIFCLSRGIAPDEATKLVF